MNLGPAHNAKIWARKTHGVVMLEAQIELGSPLKMILRSEGSSSELAGPGIVSTLLSKYCIVEVKIINITYLAVWNLSLWCSTGPTENSKTMPGSAFYLSLVKWLKCNTVPKNSTFVLEFGKPIGSNQVSRFISIANQISFASRIQIVSEIWTFVSLDFRHI